MSERAAYSRVYWSIVDDPKFESIYDDDRHLATWLRLLLIADQAHPASANIPHGTRRASVTALANAGLLDLGTASRYRIHGLDAERERRRLAATSRPPKPPVRGPNGHHSGSSENPNGFQTPGLRRDENETSRDETRDDGRDDLEAFLLITRRAPTVRQRKLLDDILERRDETGPSWAANVILSNPDDPIGALMAEDDKWRKERIAAAKSAERPKPRPRRPRGLPQSTRELIEHWAAQAKDEGKGAA